MMRTTKINDFNDNALRESCNWKIENAENLKSLTVVCIYVCPQTVKASTGWNDVEWIYQWTT